MKLRLRVREIFLELRDPVVGYLVNQGRQVGEAEDIFQNTILIILQEAENGAEEKITEAYSWAIVQSQHIDHFKREMRIIEGCLFDELESSEPGADKILNSRERIEFLQKAINTSLTAKQFVIVTEKFFFDKKNSEIAELLDIENSTVRSQIRQARDRLKDELRKFEQGM